MSSLSKKKKNQMKQEGILKDGELNTDKFSLERFEPRTENQAVAKDAWDDGCHLVLHGSAGTGKTHIAVSFALKEVLRNRQSKLVFVRNIVQGRNMGHLPGTKEEKEKEFEEVGKAMVNKLLGRNDAYHTMKTLGMIEFRSTSFNRGVEFDNAIVVVDEFQNMNFQELDTIITRAGENTRYIFSGDTKQDDLSSVRYHEESGIRQFMRILEDVPNMDFVEFTTDDITRSGLVREYLIAKENLF